MPIEDAESQMHWESMLYLLEEPTLDRQDFEMRLADDAKLGEILAQAVSDLQSLRSAAFESNTQLVTREHPTADAGRPWQQSVLALAVSLLLVGFLGWQIFLPRLGTTKIASTSMDSPTVTGVVWAWSELQSDQPESQLTRDSSEVDFENSFALNDLSTEVDTPDWLVLAAVDTLERSLDLKEERAVIQ